MAAPFRPNRRILWKKRTGEDDFGDATYAEAVEIQARVVLKTRFLSGQAGDEMRPTHNIEAQANVEIRDLLNITDTLAAAADENFEEVEARESVETVAGRTIRYICYLEPVGRS